MKIFTFRSYSKAFCLTISINHFFDKGFVADICDTMFLKQMEPK